MKAIPFEMYMLKTKNYHAVSRMKRVVNGRHWGKWEDDELVEMRGFRYEHYFNRLWA